MKRILALLVACTVAMSTMACNFASVLEETASIINKVEPFIALVPAFVCPFAAAACPVVSAADQLAQKAMTDLSADFNRWASASAAAQPGLLAQVLIAAQQAQQDQAALIQDAQVKNTAAQTEINGVASSIEGSIADLITLLEQTQAGGGTTAALTNVMDSAVPVWEREFSGPVLAAWFANPLRIFASPDTLKLRSGQTVHTFHYYKSQVIKTLAWKTTDKQVAAICATQLTLIKGL